MLKKTERDIKDKLFLLMPNHFLSLRKVWQHAEYSLRKVWQHAEYSLRKVWQHAEYSLRKVGISLVFHS